ncbi:hypothetical protein UJ203_19280 [Bacillus sp. V26]|uniref:hypothetical protein n=1 Tax=Bacillus sp. V26 TaxID=3098288 RepID=UPI002AAD022E|nr:hypothetical protein [Bacillus sp. V26]MDY7433813.1 hypothetical protein [Bacillus sp. V26]
MPFFIIVGHSVEQLVQRLPVPKNSTDPDDIRNLLITNWNKEWIPIADDSPQSD